MADLATIRIPVDSSDMVRAVKDARGLENSIKLLEKSFAAGNIGSQQFSKGLLQLKRQYEGLFGSSQKATSEVQRYARSLQEVRVAQSGLEGHINQASKGMNKFGVVAQQTGYQVSDFIVQVQSGANPLVAFSQQATQLAGLLYYLPERFMLARVAVLGFSVSMATAISAVTIGIPLLAMLAMNFFSSGKDAEEGSKGVDKYKSALDGLKSTLQSTQVELDKLTFGTKDDEIAVALRAMQDAQTTLTGLIASQRQIRGQAAPTEEEKAAIDEMVVNYRNLVLTLNEMIAKKETLAAAQGGINAAEEASRVQNLYKLQLLDEQVEKNRAVHDALLAVQNANYNYIESQKISIGLLIQQYSLYGQIAISAAEIAAASQNTQYYKLGTLNEGAMGRAGAKGQGLAESYSFVEKAAKKLTGTTKTLKKELTDAEKAAKEFADTMDGYVVGAVQSVSDAFGDFVMRGFKDFKGFVNSILSSFTSMLAQMIALAARNKIMVSMGLGGAGSIAGGVASAATGGMGGLGGIATGIGGAFGTIGSGLMTGAGLALNGGMAGIVGGVTGGISAGGLAGISTAIGAIAAPLLAVAAVFSFFKKKTKELDSGLRITVNNMDALVETFKKTETKRFWGLSRKVSTSTEAASSEIADPIETAVSAIQNSIVDMAGALNIGSEAFDNFYFQLKVSLKGLSAEEATAKVQEELMKVGDAMAEMIPDLVALSQGSETASETLTRLYTSLQLANAYFGPLIDTLFQASLAGADLASTMVQAFGSIDAFNSNMAFFAENFYTQAEQITWASDRVNKAFTDLGMTAPATADAFRILVEDLMKATASGVEGAAEQLAAVLAVQQDMLAVSVYEAEQAAEAQRLAIQLGEEARRLQEQLDRDTLRAAEEKASVEIKLLEAQGKASDALKLKREQELAALDETNRAILQQVFDLEDLAMAQQLANEAAEEAAQKALKIAEEKASVEIKLLELQSKASEALTLKREQELAAVDESNRALLRMTFALEDYNQAISEATQALEEANRAYESALGDLRSVMEREISAAQSAVDEAKSVFDTALSNSYESLQKNLGNTEQALADAQQALAEAQRRAFEEGIQNRITAVNASFNSLIANLEASLDVAQRKAEASRQVFEALDSALRDRRLASEAATFASRRSALSYVSSGGTDIDKLTSALGVLNEPSEQFFGTFQDYARDFALTTNAIKENRDLAEATMTADEKTVMLLEQQIEQSRASQEAQIEALEKMLVAQEELLTVSQAMEKLITAQENYDQAKEAHDELLLQYPQLQETFISVGDALANHLAAQATFEQVQAQHAELIAQYPMLNESVLTVAQAVTNLGSAIAAQTAATAAQVAAQTALANAIAAANQVTTTGSVPGFAAGGMFGGGPRIVGENGPELEVTGPSRIYNKQDTSNMFRDPDLASAVQGLRNEVSGMRSEQLQLQVEISKNTKRVYDVERKWDIDGLPPVRV